MIDDYDLPQNVLGKDWETAKDMAVQEIVRENYNLPKDVTSNLKAADLLNGVANLQLIGADDRISDPKVWEGIVTNGLDGGLGPVVHDQLGLPEGVRADSPASTIFEDAGILAEKGFDLGNKDNWNLLNDFKQGKITEDQFAGMGKPDRGGSGKGSETEVRCTRSRLGSAHRAGQRQH